MNYKNFLLVSVVGLLLTNILSCKNEASTKNVEINEIESDSVDVVEIDTSLNGVWVLTNYFDTIVKHKQVAKYRVQIPTWFGIILNINDDFLKSYGSIYNSIDSINLSSDTLMLFDSYSNYYLIRAGEKLQLVLKEGGEIIDSTIHIYERDSSKNYMTENLSGVFKIGHHVTDYFNDKIMSGKYKYLNSDKVVEFLSDGSLKGFGDYNEFEVNNYFGTLHPFSNLDVVHFSNREKRLFDNFNWVFRNDTLIMTEFIPEEIIYNGEPVITDDFVLGDKTITLIKVKD